MAIEHPYQEDAERGVTPYTPAHFGPTRDMMVMPLVDPQAARRAVIAYEQLKSAIVQPGDQVTVKGKTFFKRKFWRRVATCFGLDVHLVSENRTVSDQGILSYSVIYRAVAPNGRSMDGDGYCDAVEFGPLEHNVRAKAHTRAKNRAISDLVGGGEVSADELPGNYGADGDTDEDRPVTSEQRQAIRAAYQALGKPMPKGLNPATYGDAEEHLASLRAEWKAKRVTTQSAPSDLQALPVGERGN